MSESGARSPKCGPKRCRIGREAPTQRRRALCGCIYQQNGYRNAHVVEGRENGTSRIGRPGFRGRSIRMRIQHRRGATKNEGRPIAESRTISPVSPSALERHFEKRLPLVGWSLSVVVARCHGLYPARCNNMPVPECLGRPNSPPQPSSCATLRTITGNPPDLITEIHHP